jgi:hypothetical protein
MSSKKSVNGNLLAYAIVLIVIGIMLLVGGVGAANNIMGILVTVMGILLVVGGVLSIVNKQVGYGVVLLVVGILVIVFAWTLAWIAFIVLGVLLLAYGITDLVHKQGNVISNILSLLVGVAIVMVAFGNKFSWQFLNILFYIAGALTLVDGIIALVAALK